VRRRLLPAEPRVRTLACSALDEGWMDEVDTARGVLLTAQGLLMYLQPAEVHRLVAAARSGSPAARCCSTASPAGSARAPCAA
jgi:O-methyltransferase involved in polyketide biosynthesis